MVNAVAVYSSLESVTAMLYCARRMVFFFFWGGGVSGKERKVRFYGFVGGFGFCKALACMYV